MQVNYVRTKFVQMAANASNFSDITCLYRLYISAKLCFKFSDKISEGNLNNCHFEIDSLMVL
ncbi:hypothetical protein [Borrelia crocidurae]|uniref:hypothetical protein n=1 Tax=Borrelia crocidurae TaxID=29520 RepID=UPI00046D6BDF|nr:hypothetical protein [Borrelia crocidurae]